MCGVKCSGTKPIIGIMLLVRTDYVSETTINKMPCKDMSITDSSESHTQVIYWTKYARQLHCHVVKNRERFLPVRFTRSTSKVNTFTLRKLFIILSITFIAECNAPEINSSLRIKNVIWCSSHNIVTWCQTMNHYLFLSTCFCHSHLNRINKSCVAPWLDVNMGHVTTHVTKIKGPTHVYRQNVSL